MMRDRVKIYRKILLLLLFVLISLFSTQVKAQTSFTLNCAGGFSCGENSDASVSVAVMEVSRRIYFYGTANYDFVYAPSLFGNDIYQQNISGELKYFANPDLGCAAYPANTFTGKVALIDRGTCSFDTKVLNAQIAGAVGVIIVNNVAGTPFAMGGSSALGINIPVVMIGQTDGVTLKNALLQPAAVNASTPKYTYQWSCGVTTPIATGLASGTYSVTVLSNGINPVVCTTQVLANNPGVSIVTNGSLINCPFEPVELSTSSFNNAIAMNGTNQSVNCNSNLTNLNNASFTLEAWINTSSGSEGIIVCNNANNVWEAGERAFFVNDIGRPTFSGFNNNSITSNKEVDDGIWHHVAVVWDYTTPPGIGRIYVDGFDRTEASTYVASASANVGVFRLGRPNYNGNEAPNFFDGTMDEVRIWNVARSGAQIRLGMVDPVAVNSTGLLAYYKMNETSGSTVLNASNNSLNASFVNSPQRVDALTYLWMPSADTTAMITVTSSGSYTVAVKDYFGCAAISAPVHVNTVGVKPSGAIIICNGDSVLLDAGKNTNPVYGFSEFFDTNSWTTIHSANDSGWVNVSAAPNSITLTSSNTNAGGSPSSSLDYCHIMNGDGNLNFNWNYTSFNGPINDFPLYTINGNPSSYTTFNYASGAPILQNGTASIPVLKGQNFCFRMSTLNNSGSAASFQISNIQFPDSYTSYLWSTGASTQSIYIKIAGVYTVSVTASNACSISSSPISVNINSNPNQIWYADNDGDSYGDASKDSLYCFQPIGFVSNKNDCNDSLSYIRPNANENCFNNIDDNCNNIIDEGCGFGAFQIKVILEGLYIGGGWMTPTLYNAGLHPDPSASDSIQVELRNTMSPYSPVQSHQVIVHRNGFASIPTYPSNGNYFIVIKSRNNIETWSKTPVLFNGTAVFFDFAK